MRSKKTPGSTPGRTPKGFRALFSLWEGKREGRSPLRRGKSASQADVPSSPLRPMGAVPNEASETPQENEPMLRASSPAMLMAARALLSSSLTWSATPRDSGSKRPSTAAPTSQGLPARGNEQDVNQELVDLNFSDHTRTRPGTTAATPRMASCSHTPHAQTSLPQDLSTPQLLADMPSSKTPTVHGLTPPTLSAHNPFPNGTPTMADTSGEPSASDGAMSSKFSTCDEGSVEQSPAEEAERHRVEHAGHTPAPLLGMSQPPTPVTEEAVPSHHPCEPDLERCASVSAVVCEIMEDLIEPASHDAQKTDAHDNMLDAPAWTGDAPRHRSAADATVLTSAQSEPFGHAAPMWEPQTRPEVSSPIIESLERSGGSDALARAGSSGILRSGSSGAARVAAAAGSNGAAPARHRHQRSGALDFDSALLLTSGEEELDVSGAAGVAQETDPDVAALTVDVCDQNNTEDDVRGSDDSVVLHPTPCAMLSAPTGDVPAFGAATSSMLQHAEQDTPCNQNEAMPKEIVSLSQPDAPVDGIAAVAPPLDGQEPRHTAPVTAADAPSPFMSEVLPSTPVAAARSADHTTDVEMAGMTPSTAPLPQDIEMAGTTPMLAAGPDSPVPPPTSATQPISPLEVRSGPAMFGQNPTADTGITPAMSHALPELPPGTSASGAQPLSQRDDIESSESLFGYGAISAERSPTPETAVSVDSDLGQAVTAMSPPPETVVMPVAHEAVAASGCPARSPTPETVVVEQPSPPSPATLRSITPETVIVAAPGSPSAVCTATLPANTPQQSHATQADATSGHLASPVDELLATPVIAVESELPVAEGTPSQSFAIAPDSASLAPTPTAVLLARYHGHLADATAALQASDNHSTPIAAMPNEPEDGAPADPCDGDYTAMTNDASMPLSGGSLPLAMAPADSADLPAATSPIEPTSIPNKKPLPMLSPVQLQETEVVACCISTALSDPEEAGCFELAGDENEVTMPGPGGISPASSRFQVPVHLNSAPASGECGDVTPALKHELVVNVDDAASVEEATEGGLQLAAADLTMECSDAVIDHDEDSCTRMESPVPEVLAAACASTECGGPPPENTPAGQTLGAGDADLLFATEEPSLHSTTVSSAVLSQEFALRPSLPNSIGVRESMDSLIAPSGTDSILGIASGICGAAVAGALTASTSLPALSAPPSGTGTEPGALNPTPSAGAAVDTLAVGQVCSVATTVSGIPGEPSSDAVLGGGALLPTPPESGRPSMRRAQDNMDASVETPEDTAMHPISSTAFRVTDSCADRVWRMLQGSNGDQDAAAGTHSLTPTAEEVPDEIVDPAAGPVSGVGRWDSLTVPEFPSLDEEAYAQLEREALQGPDSMAELPAEVPAGQPPANRPSTPPPPPAELTVPHNGMSLQEITVDSPSLQPMFCESPGLSAKHGGRRSGSAARKAPSGGTTLSTVHRDDDLRQTAITDTLVNQSLSVSVMFAGASVAREHETLLESVLDADSAEPEALPSPTRVQPQKSPTAQSPSRRSAGQRRGCLTAPLRQVSAASRVNAMRRGSIGGGVDQHTPVTSTFDAAAIVLNSAKSRSQRRLSGAERPRTAGPRSPAGPRQSATPKRPSTSGGSASRRASQAPSVAVSPLTGQRPSSSAAKRLLSHKTIHNITPNHNPNYRPHSPGKTPQAVPPNASPDPKRYRNGALAAMEPSRLEQPLDLARDLQDVDDMCAVEAPQMGGAMDRSQGRRAGVRVSPSPAQPSGRGSEHRQHGSWGATPTSAQNLRDSLLTLDPMRLSYGPDGLVSLAGDQEEVLFQADIEAITQALDEYPSQSDLTNENSSTQPSQRPVSPRRGVSPLRVSRVLKQRTPGASDSAKVADGECDAEDLQLRLAVALRQAEHFRRENTSLQERVTSMQEFIEAEKFLTSDQDNTATLLAEVSPDARQAEVFAHERARLQAEIAMVRGKFEEQSQQMHILMTKQLPAAHDAAEHAEQELAAHRARSAAAEEAAAAAVAQEKSRAKQAMQEVGKLRTEVDRQTVCAAEATQAQRRLEGALSKAQAAMAAAEGRYQTKCKELSKTKLAKPSGIGGGIGGPKLKQDLAAMTSERNTLTAAVRDLQHEVGRVSAALHAKESQYDQLSHSFHQAMTRWEHRGA